MNFYVQIEDSSGNKLGSGPITSASEWESTGRMDRAGAISFTMPASDPKAALLDHKRRVRCYALLGGTSWALAGDGIIDQIDTEPASDGTAQLIVSGQDGAYELDGFSAGYFEVRTGDAPMLLTDAFAVLAANSSSVYSAPWTFDASGVAATSVYAQFNGESYLYAAAALVAAAGYHFYYAGDRTLVLFSAFTPSGVRAIRARGILGANTCAIASLQRTVETHELCTRIAPFGAGQGRARLTLAASNRSVPAGYTGDLATNYLQKTDAAALYGRIDRWVEFKEIAPISNTDADLQAAANALFDAAKLYLDRYSQRATHYALEVAECGQVLRPGQTIRVDYRDAAAGLTINQDLYILESTWRVDALGVRTTKLTVADVDRWPLDDNEIVADRIAEAKTYQAHPQLNANSYTTGYTKNLDSANDAGFRFRFGSEVVQLQQVLFEFQLLPFESTVKSVGGSSSGSGDIPTSGPNTDTTGTGGNNETGSGGATATGSGGPTATGSAGSGDTGSTSGDTGSTSGTTGGTTGETGTSSGSIGLGGGGDTGSGTGSVGSGGATETGSGSGSVGGTALTTDTGGPDESGSGGGGDTGTSGGQETTGPSTNETGSATGGDWNTGGTGRHAHGIDISPNISGASLVYYDGGGLAVDGVSDTFGTNVVDDHTHSLRDHKHDMANHTHSIAGHTHTVADHTHAVASHTHSVGSHTHSISTHTHTIGTHTHTITSHTHSVDAHTHSVSSHTHTVSSHTHTVSSHTHTVNAHTHTVSNHTHSIAAHTHSMSQHTHTLNNHIHDLSESITAIYGIFRESTENTYEVGELEYQVNSGGWLALSSATDVGGGWYQLDVTAAVMNATTFRPLSESNLLEIRAGPGVAITSIQGTGGGLTITPSVAADAGDVGKRIVVSGTAQYDGEYIVDLVFSGLYIVFNTNNDGPEENTGFVAIAKTVTVDALLSVRNIIQAIAYL